MKKIQLLDCTLRDGGYVNDWRFGYTNIVSVPTTTVDIYATSSGASNGKVAYVTGTSLIITNSSDVPILGQMPDFSNISTSNVVITTQDALYLQNILDENYQVKCNSIYFHYRGSNNQNYSHTFNQGDTFTSLGVANLRNIYQRQSPAAGSTVMLTDDISISFDTSDYF